VLVERQPLVTIPLRGNTTTRRRDDATKDKILASLFDGLFPLTAPRFARWQE
jgi:hypothetical protein